MNDDPVKEETVDYNYYYRLIAGKERILAFQSAIQSTVRPGDVVIEIGAGVGTYSFFAAQAGARRVYAVEKERIVQVVQELAVRNGLAQQITCVAGLSTDIELPEKADVLVLEDFSSVFVRRGIEEVVRDALDRLMKPDCRVIPQSVSLHLAPVGDVDLWKTCLTLEDDGYRLYGLDLRLLRQMALDSPHVRPIKGEALLAEPLTLKTIDLKNTTNYVFDEVRTVHIDRSGTIYGLAGWFDLKLTNTVSVTNRPGNSESTWNQVFFPFSNPLRVTKGENVTLRLSCTRSTRTRDIWWTWQASAASGVADNRSFQGVALWTGR